jgi:hypothetical protein
VEFEAPGPAENPRPSKAWTGHPRETECSLRWASPHNLDSCGRSELSIGQLPWERACEASNRSPQEGSGRIDRVFFKLLLPQGAV